jgi:hypothetical protein
MDRHGKTLRGVSLRGTPRNTTVIVAWLDPEGHEQEHSFDLWGRIFESRDGGRMSSGIVTTIITANMEEP